jgi:tetratricopeptide (TPR) repeat protein/transglutaminase-like putative cysteine protease
MRTIVWVCINLLTILSLPSLLVSAQPGPSQLSTPDSAKKLDFSKQAIILEHSITRARWESDGTGSRETEAVYRVQAESGVRALAVLAFPYSSSTEGVTVEYVRVREPDGTVVVTPDYNIQDMPADVTRTAPMYSDIHEKHVVVKGLEVGDVLEYEVRYQVLKAQVLGEFWFAYSFHKESVVKDEELEINVPDETYVNVSSPDLKPRVTVEDGRRVFRWQTENLKPQLPSEEPQRELPPPSVEVSTFHNWGEIGDWYAKLQRPEIAVTPAIQAKAEELTKGLTKDDAEIQALYNFVSNRIHYVSLSFGIGRYQPHAAEDVLENGYGDCKDKHTLLAALLRAKGYEAWPAPVNSTRKMMTDVPSPAQFDHVITVVPRGNSLIWLDSTPEVAPFGLLLSNLRDKEALVIPTNRQPTLMKTPQEPPFESYQSFDVKGKISTRGTFTGHVSRSARGDVEVLLRLGFRSASPAEWKQLVQNISYASGFGGEVDNVQVSSPEATELPFQFSYDYTRKNYSDWQDQRFTPPMPPLGIEAAKDDEKKPSEPLFLGAQGHIVYRAHMELPSGYSLTPPEKTDLATDYAEYHARYSFQNGSLDAERRFIIKKDVVPLAEWDGYLKFRKAVADEEGTWIDIRPPIQTGAASEPAINSTDADALNKAGMAALDARNYRSAEELFKKAVEINPRHKWAWNNLGLSYLGMSRIQEAAEAFQKQIEVNPQDLFAYNNLGRVLQFEGKADEAEKSFRKQIEINPKNRWAHANLGSLLLNKKKYPEAVEELKQAAAIADSAEIEESLGRAYLNMGQDKEAMAALDAAIEKAPSPPLFNNVAYALAGKGVHLDKAEQYAESAVTSLEGMLRDVQLEKLQPQQLFFVNLLGMSWDTLGWVYFKEGRLAQAENYLSAAWNLNQVAVEGDHLGQLYEKEGKKVEAEHLYAEAVAALHASAETRQRLNALAGSAKQADAEVLKAGEELSQMRTTKIKRVTSRSANAEFLISFSPGPKVNEVKFISGDKQLSNAASALGNTKYDIIFPRNESTKLVRRGILSCGDFGDSCVFVLLLPGSVRSVN